VPKAESNNARVPVCTTFVGESGLANCDVTVDAPAGVKATIAAAAAQVLTVEDLRTAKDGMEFMLTSFQVDFGRRDLSTVRTPNEPRK
jgi:hypothetical protein